MQKLGDKDYRYGENSYNKGSPEDPKRCIVEVFSADGWRSYQCQRKRGYGPNGEQCKQHARMADDA